MSNSGSHTVAPSADNKFSVAYSKPHDYMSAVPKTRPPMSDDQLAKLAVAREKALAVRRAQKVEKLKAEAARLEAPSEELQTSTEAVNTGVHPPPTAAPSVPDSPTPHPATVEPPGKPKTNKKKAAKQADPVVVVEQSSDDEDTFEAPPGVIFVKRRRTKPKAEPPPPPPSAEEVAVDYAYRRMVNGEFLLGRGR